MGPRTAWPTGLHGAATPSFGPKIQNCPNMTKTNSSCCLLVATAILNLYKIIHRNWIKIYQVMSKINTSIHNKLYSF